MCAFIIQIAVPVCKMQNIGCSKLYYLAGVLMKYIYLVLLIISAVLARGQDKTSLPQEVVLSSRVTIARILIEGNTITRSGVIMREIAIHEGDMVSRDSIADMKEEIKLRLFNLQLFNEVDQDVTPDKDSSIVWHIKVKERWFILPSITIQFADRNLNTWWVKENHDVRRASAGLTLTDKNFRGNLESLAVTVQEGYTQKLGISYMRPYVNKGQTNGVGVWFSVSQSRQAYYNTDSNKLVYAGAYSGPVIQRNYEGGLSYVYRPAYASKHTFQLNYKDYWVSDTLLQLNPEYYANKSNHARFLELFYRYEYNGVDNWNYSLNGFKLVGNGVVRKGFEGLDFQSYATIEAGLFSNIAPGWYYSFVLRGRLMYPQDQPYFFRGGLGTQTDYVRGYEYYVIDGSNYGLLRFDFKREIFNRTWSFPVKYFTAIPLRIYPKIFADAGYITSPSPGNSFLSNRFLYSYGAGIDVVTLYDIKIRLEYAWNHLNQNGLYLHFNSE